jgi:hypothetical protein
VVLYKTTPQRWMPQQPERGVTGYLLALLFDNTHTYNMGVKSAGRN